MRRIMAWMAAVLAVAAGMSGDGVMAQGEVREETISRGSHTVRFSRATETGTWIFRLLSPTNQWARLDASQPDLRIGWMASGGLESACGEEGVFEFTYTISDSLPSEEAFVSVVAGETGPCGGGQGGGESNPSFDYTLEAGGELLLNADPLVACLGTDISLSATYMYSADGMVRDDSVSWSWSTDIEGGGEAELIATNESSAVFSATVPGEYRIFAQSLSDPGASNTVTVTAYEVTAIEVIPRGAPEEGWQQQVAAIGAGGLGSDAHMADILVHVLPALAGLPVKVEISGGRGTNPELSARLADESGEASDSGLPDATSILQLSTGSDGIARAVLTSSDTLGQCAISACGVQADVRFEWDDVVEPGEWVLLGDEEPLPPASIPYKVRLGHHREASEGGPWQPFAGHEFRLFVERVELEDGTILENTPSNPSDLGEFAHFDMQSYTADENGEVFPVLSIADNREVLSVGVALYDWSVHREGEEPTDEPQPQMQMSAGSFTIQAAQAGQTSDERSKRAGPRYEEWKYKRAVLLYHPVEVPVVPATNTISPQSAGEVLVYLQGVPVSGFELHARFTRNGVAVGPEVIWIGAGTPVAITNGLLVGAPPGWQSGISGRIVARQPGRYKAELEVKRGNAQMPFKSQGNRGIFEFDAIEGELAVVSNSVIRVEGAGIPRYVFPVKHWATLDAEAPVKTVATVAIAAKPENGSGGHSFVPRFEGSSSLFFKRDGGELNLVGVELFATNRSARLEATAEGAGMLDWASGRGRFILPSRHRRWQIHTEMVYEGSEACLRYFGHPQEIAPVQVDLIGVMNQSRLICPDVRIVRPTGALPPAGEPGAASASEALLVFDTPAAPGKCVARCEAAELAGLTPADRELVWGMLEWELPDVGSVGPGDAEEDDGGRVATYTYEGMPPHNDAFGNTNVVLSFEVRPQWAYYQPVQFRYQRTGTSAAAAVLAAGTLSANHVVAGNPNWYVYWQQVANQKGFGPQTHMAYNSSEFRPGTTNELAVYAYNFGGTSFVDKIFMYDANQSNIFRCVRSIHHENGHRNSKQLPNEKGGWGIGLSYNAANDVDRDGIFDSWESEGGHGHTLGFSVDDVTSNLDQKRRGAWEHGWDSLEDAAAGLAAGNYTNPAGFQDETGRGLCCRNEALVAAEETEIKKMDWSHIAEGEFQNENQ